MKSRSSRRVFLHRSATATAGLAAARLAGSLPLFARQPSRRIAAGPFKPTWESLSTYKCPDWFRDAKFGIWAHWSAQCVPEQGDWYARRMYIQGDRAYDHHVQTYGHPSKFGFMEIDNLWKAERWDPEALMTLYYKAGAKYFFALANHHDNFDAYGSKHHAWNSVNVGPKKDIVGLWARAARARGMRFGVSNHSAHAWHWFQVAYGYDGEGPLAGVRYDAARLKKADARGTWWDGLDPQDLYTGPSMVIPDGIAGAKAVLEWHNAHDRVWTEEPPANNPAFVEKWFLRCQDLVDSYQPDVLYFDDTELPLGQAGLDIVAHYYNASVRRSGDVDVVATAKKMTDAHRAAVVEDIERGVATDIRAAPWQTDTCIGSWHYDRELAARGEYKTTAQVVGMLVDIVSKNGNLMLSVPMRGDGSIDQQEVALLDGMARWIAVNGEGLFATRPWTLYGEGPSTVAKAEAGQFGGARDVRRDGYTSADVRFTRKADLLYAYLMAWPADRRAVITSLGKQSPHLAGRAVTEVSMLGRDGRLEWSQGERELTVTLPEVPRTEHAVALRIRGAVA